MISFGAVNLIGWGVFIGTTRAKLEAMKEDIRDIPKIINGTVVRAHESRCQNFYPQRTDQTNPRLVALQ
jgi:hypothetical protein